MTLTTELRNLQEQGAFDLPPLGEGDTAGRWRGLAGLARGEVSVGRLAEAHLDGHQILREAGRPHPADRLVGVWASEHPRWTVSGTFEDRQRRLALRGSKAFCTGAGIVDDALITVAVDGQTRLVLVPGEAITADRIDTSGWSASALADTRTAVVDLDGIEVAPEVVVGEPGWYLDRPGFWHGAVGPAACWGGGALGLVDHAVAHPPSGPHGRAHLGAMVAAGWAIEAALDRAGRATDHSPGDVDAAHRVALITRHLIDAQCADIGERFARALGPRPLVDDPAVIERHAALTIYRRQCHGERDLEDLGTLPQ
ncbi:acyl-CoA dehydrogenase [soil metagenome]